MQRTTKKSAMTKHSSRTQSTAKRNAVTTSASRRKIAKRKKLSLTTTTTSSQSFTTKQFNPTQSLLSSLHNNNYNNTALSKKSLCMNNLDTTLSTKKTRTTTATTTTTTQISKSFFSTITSPPIIDLPRFVPKMLAGKKIIITGASSGIGAAAVADAIKEGAQVVAIGRNEEKLKELQQQTKCFYLVGDLVEHEDCKRMVDEAAIHMDGITSLVNCAGVLKGGAVGSVGIDNFQYNFANNTQSVWSMMEHVIPYLKLHDDGTSIVNISSVNGQQSFGGVAAYCAAKAAVDMLSKCAAIDLAPFKIRVNSICPGVVETNLQKRGGLTEEAYAGFLERSKTVTHPLAIPRGEVAQPQDVANLITFLVSDKSKWITGDNIKIDGGRSAMGAR